MVGAAIESTTSTTTHHDHRGDHGDDRWAERRRGGPTGADPSCIPGALQQPDDASASYPFTGAGAMEVSASSTVDRRPLAHRDVPGWAPRTRQGPRIVSVVIPDADGPCDVVLKETAVQYVAVPYTLTIGPEGG